MAFRADFKVKFRFRRARLERLAAGHSDPPADRRRAGEGDLVDAGMTGEQRPPGVGPEHSYWKDTGRVEYCSVTDAEALDGFELIAKTEGIIPALESAHAIYKAAQMAKTMTKDQIVVVNLSGRGDKDCQEVARLIALRKKS